MSDNDNVIFIENDKTKHMGWANYETWNVALWIQNTEEIYKIAKQFDNYKDFINLGLKSLTPIQLNEDIVNDVWLKKLLNDPMTTGDDVSFTDKLLNIEELDNMIKELS